MICESAGSLVRKLFAFIRGIIRVGLVLGPPLLAGCRPSDPLVARVGRLPITEAEFHKKLAEVGSEYRNYLLTPNGRRQFLEILIREKLILAAAEESKIANSSEFLAEIQKLKEEQEVQLSEFKDFLMRKMWMDDLKAKGILQVSDAEVDDYYRKHPKEVKLRHILLAAPEEAEVLLKKVRRGDSFAALAKTNSLDADTASNGGLLPSFMYGEVLPELEDVAFRMRVGEITGVVGTKFGYHVLKKESETQPPLSKVRERIQRLLEKKKLDQYLTTFQEKYRVQILDEQFK
ncbi:MAG: peptidylprolyl isomerase [Elusimicrobia bacterium]|nr:peptidylprolyl isomerase [Elusimicrobiota bacterium]